MQNYKEKILFLIISLILTISIVNLILSFKKPKQVILTSTPSQQSLTQSALFSSQSATVKGKILSVKNNKLEVENDQNIQGTLDLGRVIIINNSDQLRIASNSADFQKIPLNKTVQINLVLISDKYVVSSITE